MAGAPLARSPFTLSKIGCKPQESRAKVRMVFSVRWVTPGMQMCHITWPHGEMVTLWPDRMLTRGREAAR